MSTIGSETLSTTDTLGESSFSEHLLHRHVMEYLSIAAHSTNREELKTYLNQVYDDLLRSEAIIGLDPGGTLQGIQIDANIKKTVEHAARVRQANPGKALRVNKSSLPSKLTKYSPSTSTSSAGPLESTRPLRSNTKAPDIPPTQPFSLEHQLRQLEKQKQKQSDTKKEK